MLYHVAPLANLEEILNKGIKPLVKQGYRRTEEEAVELFLERWGARCGREEVIGDSDWWQMGRTAVNHVYAFDSLDQARKWAAEEDREMVIVEIGPEMGQYFHKDYECAVGEVGAMMYQGDIDPEYLKVVK